MVTVLLSSWPNSITYAFLALRSVSDVYVLGKIDVNSQAAWATSYALIVMFMSFGMGALFAVNSLVSKNEGRRWFANSGCVTWQGIWFCIVSSTGVIAFFFFVPLVIGLFGHDPELAVLEIEYLQIALISTTFQLFAWTIIHFFIGIHRPGFPMAIAAITLVTHVFFNFALTMGHFGFPQMGIAGAAWSMVFSSCAMAGSALLMFILPKSLRKYHTKSARPRMWMFKKVVQEGVPIGGRQILDEFVWNIVLIWIIGQFGTIHLAAAGVIISILDLFILPFDSIGVASVALIGKSIGAKKSSRAEKWKTTCLFLTSVFAAILGLLFYIFRKTAIPFFSDSNEVIELSLSLAFIVPIFLLIFASYSTYDYALCATDDNSWPSMISLVSTILILGGGGVILVMYFFDTGSVGAWGLLVLNILVITILYAIRWSLGYWKPNPVRS